MDKKTSTILVTVAAILLCGCPGLFFLLTGGTFAVVSFIPGADINVMGSSDPGSALTFGIGALCVGALLVLIAAAAIILVRRRGSGATNDSASPVE